MEFEISDQVGDTIRVNAGGTGPGVWVSGSVGGDPQFRAEFDFAPAQARELAAALLRAADEAEGRKPAGALAHIMAVLDMQHDADEIAEDPSILTEIRTDAERIVRMVRAEVARDLEQMDGTNLGMSLNRTQAVRVARTGLEPMDVQRDR
jgi:hypothetical protein